MGIVALLMAMDILMKDGVLAGSQTTVITSTCIEKEKMTAKADAVSSGTIPTPPPGRIQWVLALLPDQLTAAAGCLFAREHTWTRNLPGSAALWQAVIWFFWCGLRCCLHCEPLTKQSRQIRIIKVTISRRWVPHNFSSWLSRVCAHTPRPYSAQYGRQRALVDVCNYFLPVHWGSNFSSPGGAQLEVGCEAVQKPER